VNRGRARPLRLPLERASAPCSGRSTRLGQQAKCSRAVAGAVAFHREARFGADGGERRGRGCGYTRSSPRGENDEWFGG
jgi:hypothetical protein